MIVGYLMVAGITTRGIGHISFLFFWVFGGACVMLSWWVPCGVACIPIRDWGDEKDYCCVGSMVGSLVCSLCGCWLVISGSMVPLIVEVSVYLWGWDLVLFLYVCWFMRALSNGGLCVHWEHCCH